MDRAHTLGPAEINIPAVGKMEHAMVMVPILGPVAIAKPVSGRTASLLNNFKPTGYLPVGLCVYLAGLKLSFRLTERLNTKCSAEESLESGQK